MANLMRIRGLMGKQKVSVKTLSDKLGITETGLRKMITNNSTKIETLEKIAFFFDVPVSYFFNEPQTESKKYLELRDEFEKFKNDHKLEMEIVKENRKRLQTYEVLEDFYFFLEFVDVCDAKELNKFIGSKIENIDIVKTPSFSTLMEYFTSFNDRKKSVLSLFEFVSQKKFKKSRLSKDISNIYRQWYVNYMNDKNMKKQP